VEIKSRQESIIGCRKVGIEQRRRRVQEMIGLGGEGPGRESSATDVTSEKGCTREYLPARAC
jgi:hypothetical protein